VEKQGLSHEIKEIKEENEESGADRDQSQ